MTGPEATVDFRDAALAALVADAARAVPGVVQLQRRPLAGAAGLVGAAVGRRASDRAGDTSAVELGRDAAGRLDVAVRLVSTLRPTPLEVVADVGDAVRARLAEVGQDDVRVEITVTDVRF